MPIFYKDDRKVLYIHVPKTGGTSIEKFFEENGFGVADLDRTITPPTLNSVRRCSPQHFHAEILTSVYNVEKFDYIFATVRHPVSRILSEYKMHAQPGWDVNSWILRSLSVYEKNQFFMDNHLRPQHEFIVPGCQVTRLEDGYGEEWVRCLEDGIKTRFAKRAVSTQMRSNSQDVSNLLTSATLDKIVEVYDVDYSAFRYTSLRP